MNDQFELWGGINLSHTPEEILALYPDARGTNPIELCSLCLFDCEFTATWKQREDGNRVVQLDLIRPLAQVIFRDVRQQIVAGLSEKYGRGSSAIRDGTLYIKRWDRRFVRVQLTAVDHPGMETACIEYFRPLNFGTL